MKSVGLLMTTAVVPFITYVGCISAQEFFSHHACEIG